MTPFDKHFREGLIYWDRVAGSAFPRLRKQIRAVLADPAATESDYFILLRKTGSIATLQSSGLKTLAGTCPPDIGPARPSRIRLASCSAWLASGLCPTQRAAKYCNFCYNSFSAAPA